MTEKHSTSQTIIDRYLADRLCEAEREMVETRIVHDVHFRNEVELTEALRDGLRQLQAQGQVEPLLKPRSWMWRRSPFAIAAGVLACAIGVATFLVNRPLDDGRQVLATETLRFIKTRSGDARPDVIWQQSSRPTQIEMRFDIGLEPAAEYRVVVERISNGATAPVHEILVVHTVDEEVSITVDSTLLTPGDYSIRLVPQSPDRLQEATTYALRVAD
jgi:hypothetical protein